MAIKPPANDNNASKWQNRLFESSFGVKLDLEVPYWKNFRQWLKSL